MIYHVTIGGRSWTVELGPDGTRVDGRDVSVDLGHHDGSPIRSLLVDGASHRLAARRVASGRWELHLRGRRVRAEVVDERTRVIRELAGVGQGPAGPSPVVAPMPGLVVRVEVAEGDVVRRGQGIVIVEAMKMENELSATADAVVTRVRVAQGETVEKDQVLVELAAPDEVEAGSAGGAGAGGSASAGDGGGPADG